VDTLFPIKINPLWLNGLHIYSVLLERKTSRNSMNFWERLYSGQITLADIPRGMRVRILSMDNLPVERRDHLLTFGLTPGQWVEIKQHRPAIIAQIDFTELALEPDVARKILVENPVPVRRSRHFKRRAARRRRHFRQNFFRRRRKKGRRRFLSRFFGIDDDKE